jgi:hypothetical protein
MDVDHQIGERCSLSELNGLVLRIEISKAGSRLCRVGSASEVGAASAGVSSPNFMSQTFESAIDRSATQLVDVRRAAEGSRTEPG